MGDFLHVFYKEARAGKSFDEAENKARMYVLSSRFFLVDLEDQEDFDESGVVDVVQWTVYERIQFAPVAHFLDIESDDNYFHSKEEAEEAISDMKKEIGSVFSLVMNRLVIMNGEELAEVVNMRQL